MNAPDFDRATFLAMAPGSIKDPCRLARLAAAYEKSTRNSLVNLASAIEQKNLAKTREIGHKLKSGSTWFGALALGLIGEKLENLPNDVEMNTLRPLWEIADASFTKVLGEIATTLAQLRKPEGHCYVIE